MSIRPWQLIKWEKPAQSTAERAEPIGVDFKLESLTAPIHLQTESVQARTLSSLRSAFEVLGRPRVPGYSPLGEAQVLLKAGAEVEHALLVEYLYACWSIGNSQTATRVLEIAIQEMCHFITVQNLLLFTGDLPFLNRQDQDPSPGLAPFPFSLRPFTKSVLESFLLAEMPPLQDMSPQQRQVMEPLIASHQVHPVGLIYAQVYWLFQENDQPTAAWPEAAAVGAAASLPAGHIDSFPGQSSSTTFQVDSASEPNWRLSTSHNHGGVFALIDSREAALRAIAAIAAQGEGLISTPGAPSHFETFLDIYQTTNFDPQAPPSRPTDPFVADQPSPDPGREANRITFPLATALCSVFDARYRIMLASIRAALSHDRSKPQDAAVRAGYSGWALEEMMSSITFLSGATGRLPCKAGGTAGQFAAAPTFNLGTLDLPDDPKALDDLLLSLHRSAAAAITATLAQNPDAVTRLNLQQMQQRDRKRFPNL